MLAFEVRAEDLGRTWTPRNSFWRAGQSTIAPYRHPALHADLITTIGRTAVIVRERVRGRALPTDGTTPRQCSEREYDRLVGDAKTWPLEFVLLTISTGPDSPVVRLTCGRWGTAPIYLHEASRVLRGHWDVAELYPYLRSTALDPGIAARCLIALDHPYSKRTIFPEISMLTERATATWSAPFERVKLRYPRAEEHATAVRFKARTDIEAAMREIIATSMRRWLPSDHEHVAVELSGGLDSSTVAAAAASLTAKRVHSYSMIMPGKPGWWQNSRRDAVIRRFRIRDRNFPCISEPPFNPRSRRVRDHSTVPWGEFYEEAVGRLLDVAHADGATMIFTGMGGDELCSYQSGETGRTSRKTTDADENLPSFLTTKAIDAYAERATLIDDAPQSLLYTSALESAAAVSTLYLRHGMWPVSPLVTPELVEFCRRLPFRLRHKRTIHRRLLTSYGLCRIVAYPNPKRLEDFNGVMSFAMHKAAAPVIAPLFEQSRLADQGFVHRSDLVEAYRRVRSGTDEYSTELLGAAVLELTLSAVEKRRKNVPPAFLPMAPSVSRGVNASSLSA